MRRNVGAADADHYQITAHTIRRASSAITRDTARARAGARRDVVTPCRYFRYCHFLAMLLLRAAMLMFSAALLIAYADADAMPRLSLTRCC